MRLAGLLAGLLLACVPAQAALRIETDPAGLDAAELRASAALLDEAHARLPPAMRTDMRLVHVRWRDLPEGVHGRARGGQIILRRALLDGWMLRLPGAGVQDPASRAALAAVLHELAHVYDRGGARLSSDPRLLDLAGWSLRPLRFGLRGRRNDFRDRSPDLYELASPAEFVAVNFEYFLLDPDYTCRRPMLHRYFAAHFGWTPVSVRCATSLPYVSTDPDAGVSELLQIDPSRVYAVDYLLAEGNEQPMSRWGHSMLRLVICAPGRSPGPECRLDLSYHRVLSFRAFVDDVQVSNWRGLTGRYPSRLFVLPLDQVVDEYTKIELRGLQSVPLRLGNGGIPDLLERAARVHWSYDGRYYFISNNCAVETWKLLHDGVPWLASQPLRSITPNGLLRKLARAGVADLSVLDDRQAAIRYGYYFESLATHYDEMFAIATATLDLPAANADGWFALDPARRAPSLQRAGLREGAALLLLEQAAMRREQLLARDDLKQRYFRGDVASSDKASDTRDAMRELLQGEAYAGRPALLLKEGYGLPQMAEREQLEGELAARNRQAGDSRTGLFTRVRELLPRGRRERLQGIEANLALLRQRLRESADAETSDAQR